VDNRWGRRLSRTIVLPNGPSLVTLDDARAFIIELPEHRHSAQWSVAVGQLLEAAEYGGKDQIARATQAIELAFFHEGKINTEK
jgi:hypothetical protein